MTKESFLNSLEKFTRVKMTEDDLYKKMYDDLNLDSLDQAEIALNLEDEFGIEIPTDEWPKTFNEVYNIVQKKLEN